MPKEANSRWMRLGPSVEGQDPRFESQKFGLFNLTVCLLGVINQVTYRPLVIPRCLPTIDQVLYRVGWELYANFGVTWCTILVTRGVLKPAFQGKTLRGQNNQ